MYTIHMMLEGVVPMLFNGWSEQALIDLEDKKTGGKKTIAERHAEAQERIYWRNDEGKAAAPPIPVDGTVRLAHVRPPLGALKEAVLLACSRAGLKEGKTGLDKFLEATLFPDPEAEFEPVNTFMHRVWGRVPPRTGAAAIIRRPAIEAGWRLPIALHVTDDLRDPTRIVEAVMEAGRLVGIGSWRPEYGRFRVIEAHIGERDLLA